MKKKTSERGDAMELHDRAEPYIAGRAAMVRTQVYLTRAEHEFLAREAERRGAGMSAVLRAIIDERMSIPEEAWTMNPMLDPTPDVPGWEGREDGALNHDHYIYGSPKNYEKRGDEWVEVPPGER